jgi:cytochrome c biogenesis factor
LEYNIGNPGSVKYQKSLKNKVMKTKTLSTKTISTMLISGLLSSQHVFAQKQNMVAEANEPSRNLTFILCMVLFIAGFALLIVLKLREDNKEKKQLKEDTLKSSKYLHMHHPNHYKHKHQLHHH